MARKTPGTPAPERLTEAQRQEVKAWRKRRFPWITDKQLVEQWDYYVCWTVGGDYRFANHASSFKAHITRQVEKGVLKAPAGTLGSSPKPPETEHQRQERLDRERRWREAEEARNRATPLEVAAEIAKCREEPWRKHRTGNDR